MMALALLDTKWAGAIQPDPDSAQAGERKEPGYFRSCGWASSGMEGLGRRLAERGRPPVRGVAAKRACQVERYAADGGLGGSVIGRRGRMCISTR